MNELHEGIYEELLTMTLREQIDFQNSDKSIIQLETLEEQLLPDFLTRSLHEHIRRKISSTKDQSERYRLANKILEYLSDGPDGGDAVSFFIDTEKNLLTSVYPKTSEEPQRPSVPLKFPTLFTGATGSPQLGKELELEFETADRVDLLVSFIKNSGLNLIFPALTRFSERGGKLRVITTTYMGASDPTAIEKLSKLPGTQVKVSYDTRSSRLHAKAYFIHRDSGLSCAYIGSANISRPAITDGLEWTVKLPVAELPHLFRRCEAEFESYWESPDFHLHIEGDLEKFTKASNAERQHSQPTSLTLYELRPRPYQQVVLDNLNTARTLRKHFRNLVVAATGTGKTLIAAFDYKRLCEQKVSRPRLLFLVHRKEILRQALDSFRQVLQDHNFGEILADGSNPTSHDYLFCSVASFGTRQLRANYPADHWEVVILDEAHHGEATTYRSILTELRPRILLGLTATPERADGISIAKDFDHPLAAEIRLPDALEKKLLCPFHYFAISDSSDFSGLTWSRGRYLNSELDDLLTGDDIRVGLIIKKIVEYLPSPLEEGEFDSRHVKGLGFCVSQNHAEFMAKRFNDANIRSAFLTSATSSDERESVRKKLTRGELNFIFVVDLYNEGVDIPEVNTILFLRPTESHVVYLQQFGRGLRLSNDEKHLVVLDFIGNSRKEFRYDLRLSSLLPNKRNDLIKEIEQGFPHLPAGCYISFERTAKERILKNIRQTYRNIDARVDEAFSQWKGGAPPSFNEFIHSSNEDPLELLTRRSWSEWKELSGFQIIPPKINAPALNHIALARVSLCNSPSYLSLLTEILTSQSFPTDKQHETPYAESLYQLLWSKNADVLGFSSLTESFQTLRACTRTQADLLEVIEHARESANAKDPPHLRFPCPLEMHGIYSRQEIFAAFGKTTFDKQSSNREGVMHLHDINASLHLFTFNKSKKFFSETTSYRDYPISQTLIHWESQSNTSRSSPVGQKYLTQADTDYTVLLFARVENKIGKLSSPHCYLGPAKFIKAAGDNPISMVWELETPMPYDFFIQAKRAAGVS
jgi:superfamily II DNA or RNA helicase/HKD family nuclease